jgi:adenosylhomocysteine nucleosidase
MTYAPLTLVCFAVKEEARYFQRLARGHPEIGVLLTGMGRRNAEQAVAAALTKSRPERVITAGFAGGLTPNLITGTVVFFVDEATGLEEGLRAAGARPVRFHCAEKVVTTATQKRALLGETGAEAVEMESHFIHALCQEHKVPAATVRVILDTASEDLAMDFNQLMTPDQRIDGCKLGMELLKSPGKIKALLRLQKQSAVAARRLGEVLGRVLHFA